MLMVSLICHFTPKENQFTLYKSHHLLSQFSPLAQSREIKISYFLVRFPDPLGKWVGRTNPLRAGIFLQKLLALKMLIAPPMQWVPMGPPYMSHIIGFCSMWTRAGRCQNLGKLLLVLARADLAMPPVCPLSRLTFISVGEPVYIFPDSQRLCR